MTMIFNPSGEARSHKLAAVFEDRTTAERAEQAIVEQTALASRQVDVLLPGETGQERALLPDSDGIWRTLVRAHLVFGIAGGLFGFGVFLLLKVLGVAAVDDNPTLAMIVLVHVPALLGLLLGGLFTLRPDQLPYVRIARDALEAGHAVVVVHAESSGQLGEVRAILEDPSLKTVRTA